MFSFFNTRHVTEFAESIAKDLKKLIPPEQSSAKPISTEKQQLKLQKLVHRVAFFSSTNKLNFYQRAKFANTLKWSMRESGYGDNFINIILGILLTKM